MASASSETDLTSITHLPELPVEIIMQILHETAAISLQSAASVSVVTSWARKLALPYLFSTIIHCKAPLTYVQAQHATSSVRPLSSRSLLPEYLGQYVRNLWTESIGIASPTSEIDIFHACPNVEHVALPAPALRTLFMLCQSVAKLNQAGYPNLPFLASLTSMTLITHTLRYEWHFLVGLRIPNGRMLLDNITHLRMLDMQISAFVPHAHLSNLTHLALPFLDLGANVTQDVLRLPEGVLEHPKLQMVVLTVDERKYLCNPWYHIIRYSASGRGDVKYSSPRASFCMLIKQAREKDDRIHVILSPRISQSACEEWETDAWRGESIWEKAIKARNDPDYGLQLPVVYSTPGRR